MNRTDSLTSIDSEGYRWFKGTDSKDWWMKHPFWIINSTLFLLLILALFFIFFSQTSVPEKEDIEPAAYSRIKR